MSSTNSSELILQSLSEAISNVAESVAQSVVRIGSGRGQGTGIVWSKDGYIVTANHVVGRQERVEVGLKEAASYEGRVVGRDPYTDVALVKVEATNLKPIETGDSEAVKLGQFVLALANPFGQKPSVTSGIVTSPKRSIRGWWRMALEDVIITDARLNPGYSGGPLVDASGKMIGLNTAYISSRGVAIPTSAVKRIVETLISDGKIKRAYLGVVSEPIELPKEAAQQVGTGQDEGLIVLQVEAESPARKAGLTIGDVIVKLDGHVVSSLQDLHGILTKQLIGRSVKLGILRGEKPTELTVAPSEAGSW